MASAMSYTCSRANGCGTSGYPLGTKVVAGTCLLDCGLLRFIEGTDMTTAELIEKLQEADLDGTKAIGIDVAEADDMKTKVTVDAGRYWVWIKAKQ